MFLSSIDDPCANKVGCEVDRTVQNKPDSFIFLLIFIKLILGFQSIEFLNQTLLLIVHIDLQRNLYKSMILHDSINIVWISQLISYSKSEQREKTIFKLELSLHVTREDKFYC